MRISDWSSDVCSSDLLHTKVTDDKFTSNPRDFGGGREDAVIIKDITHGANCAVAPGTAGHALGANSFVNFVNNTINTAGLDVNGNGSVGPGQGAILQGPGLQGTTHFPHNDGLAKTGA